MCIRRFASRLKPLPQISQRWTCSARSSAASISTMSSSSPIAAGGSEVGGSDPFPNWMDGGLPDLVSAKRGVTASREVGPPAAAKEGEGLSGWEEARRAAPLRMIPWTAEAIWEETICSWSSPMTVRLSTASERKRRRESIFWPRAERLRRGRKGSWLAKGAPPGSPLPPPRGKNGSWPGFRQPEPFILRGEDGSGGEEKGLSFIDGEAVPCRVDLCSR